MSLYLWVILILAGYGLLGMLSGFIAMQGLHWVIGVGFFWGAILWGNRA